MRNPFRRTRPLYAAMAVELATFGRRLSALWVDANRHGHRYSDADLERMYAAEIDRAAERITRILEAHRR